ncbi:MAG: hypothetical protein ACRC8M_01515 [Cetobacterium sp.]|uniref:hypothetical protein n=1 Tax=Cetobacterium sp. TaxID=2071632 RepID=UPI003F36F7C1
MLSIYKYFLLKEDSEKINRFILLEELIKYIAINNGLEIPDTYLIKIIKCYLNNQKYIQFIENRFDRAYYFCENIIDSYNNNQISKFNFFLKESNLAPDFQEWILMSKENIIKICEYYSTHPQNMNLQKENYQNIIYSNKFFNVVHVKRNGGTSLKLTYCYNSGITIRIMLKGKLYYKFYKNNILLNEEEVLITTANTPLQKCLLYSESIEVLIIHLKYEFLSNISINPIKNFITKFYYANSIDDFNKIINQNFLINNLFFFYEVLYSLLKQSKLLKENSLLGNSSINISNLVFCIKINLKLKIDKVIKNLELCSNLSRNKLENLIYLNFKVTLTKLIIKLKIGSIVQEFFNSNQSIEDLIISYHIRNIDSFKYYLKSIYKINLRLLKQMKIKKSCLKN